MNNVINFPEKKEKIIPSGYKIIKHGNGFLAKKKFLFWYNPLEFYESYHDTYDEAVKVCYFESLLKGNR